MIASLLSSSNFILDHGAWATLLVPKSSMCITRYHCSELGRVNQNAFCLGTALNLNFILGYCTSKPRRVRNLGVLSRLSGYGNSSPRPLIQVFGAQPNPSTLSLGPGKKIIPRAL